MAMATWVREALGKAGLSQAEAARRLTKALGREIDRAAVNKMCIIRPKRGQKLRSLQADEMVALEEITGHPAPGSNTSRVPLLSWVSAGKLTDASSQIPVEDVPLLAFADLGSGRFFALKVQGDSVDRVSPDGSVIVVNREDTQLIPGKFYVFSYRGETTYKMWQDDPDHLSPYSTNPANKPIFVKRKNDLEVIGRVKRSLIDL